MRTSQIQSDDIVEVLIRGGRLVGRVTAISDGVVYFNPICPGAGWRHAKAREVVTHWRKTGRKGGEPAENTQSDPSDRSAGSCRSPQHRK